MILTIHSPGRKKFVGDRDLGKKQRVLVILYKYPSLGIQDIRKGTAVFTTREDSDRSLRIDRKAMRTIYYATVDASVPYHFYLTCLLCSCVCLLARNYARTCLWVCLCVYVQHGASKKNRSIGRTGEEIDRSPRSFVRSFVFCLKKVDVTIDRSIEKIDPRSSRKGFIQDFGWYFWSIG